MWDKFFRSLRDLFIIDIKYVYTATVTIPSGLLMATLRGRFQPHPADTETETQRGKGGLFKVQEGVNSRNEHSCLPDAMNCNKPYLHSSQDIYLKLQEQNQLREGQQPVIKCSCWGYLP